MNAKRIGLVLGASLCMAACGELDAGSGPGGGEPVPKSSVQFDLVDSPDFTGNSVWICGQRVDEHGDPLPADDKYPCLNELCECFDFSADGGLLEIQRVGFNGGPRRGALEDLCPSSNIPEASWRFRYAIYSEPLCAGDVLNGRGNPNNFACYDSLDIYDQEHPNKSIEWLDPGPNHNEVICLTRNAKKTWDFDVCVDETYEREAAAGILRADCGCYLADNQAFVPDPEAECICPQDLGTLPDNCTVSAENWCRVVCTPPVPVCDNPSVCYHYTPCDPAQSSCADPICGTTAEGGATGLCIEGALTCSTLHGCNTTADCADDGVCVVGSCCGRNVCVTPAGFCGGEGVPAALSVPGEATLSAPATAF